MTTTRLQSSKRNQRSPSLIWLPWVSTYLIGIFWRNIWSKMKKIRILRMISVKILSLICCVTSAICMLTASQVIGRTLERFLPCGRQIWRCSIRRTVVLICLTKIGVFTAGTAVWLVTESARMPFLKIRQRLSCTTSDPYWLLT